MIHPSAFALAVVFALALPVRAQEGVRKDGNWDIELEVSIDGRTISSTTRQCVTKAASADPMRSIPGGADAKVGCTMSDYKEAGPLVTWTMTCEGPPPMRTKGEYTYGVNSYAGTMTMDRSGQMIVTKVKGKRLGDCTAPEER